MKKLLFFLLFTFYFQLGFAQSWVWGKAGYGALKANMVASPVATDRFGNAYMGGAFQNFLILGNDTLYSNINETAFLAKYTPAGNVAWGKLITGNFWSYTNGLATDAAGDIYAAGDYSGNEQADTFTLYDANAVNFNVYLIKYNTNGNVVWVRQSTLPTHLQNSNGYGCSVATDNMGNVMVSGLFTDTVSFGSFKLNTKYNTTDAFLVKYDSSGTILWAKQSATPSGHSSIYTYAEQICSVATDKLGNSYITGSFYDTISFGATTLIAHNTGCIFLVKYSPVGTVVWAKQSKGPKGSQCVSYSVITDRSGNPYITGFFSDTTQFGVNKLYANQLTTFFVKYDTNGNVIWAKQSSPGWVGSGLTSDGFNGHVYMAGSCLAQADSLIFGNYPLYTKSNNASFVMEFDTSGNPICGSVVNNLGFLPFTANGIASYYIGITGAYIYTASTYQGDTVFCGPDTLLPNGGLPNTFMGKWQTCDGQLGIQNMPEQKTSVSVYPNPSSGVFNFVCHSEGNEESNSNIEVYNMLGAKVYSNSFTIDNSQFTINLGDQSNGIYLYRVIDENGSLIGDGKLIIQK